MFSRYGNSLQLALRHSGARLYGLSQRFEPNDRLVYALFGGDNPADVYREIAFEIQTVGAEIWFRGAEMNVDAFAAQFTPLDPYPQEASKEISMKQFRFFKTVNPDLKDLILDPSRVPELLDMALKLQIPEQEAIRRRQQSRENMNSYREMFKPEHQIQAQIITLAS